jgi:hypothetical protein
MIVTVCVSVVVIKVVMMMVIYPSTIIIVTTVVITKIYEKIVLYPAGVYPSVASSVVFPITRDPIGVSIRSYSPITLYPYVFFVKSIPSPIAIDPYIFGRRSRIHRRANG